MLGVQFASNFILVSVKKHGMSRVFYCLLVFLYSVSLCTFLLNRVTISIQYYRLDGNTYETTI